MAERDGTGAADRLFETVYEDLRRIARRERGPSDTLNTTALVHELYLRLAHGDSPQFGERKQFYVYAARAMRHLLVDRARHRLRNKRGGQAEHVALDDGQTAAAPADALEALALDQGLSALEAEDARAAQVVALHYFCGLEIDEIAKLFEVTRRTIDRDLQFARAFLQTRLPS
jgi:RNA polymerase sigma factor (TIGR02999 family)